MTEPSKSEKFVQARARGLTRREASQAAGLAGDGSGTEKLVSVQTQLAEIRKKMALDSGVSKESIVNMLVDAAEMARTMADPMGMIAAARELGKMLGHYAPEVKKIEKGISQSDLLKALENLPDEELLRLTHGKVVEGEVIGKTVEKLPNLQA